MNRLLRWFDEPADRSAYGDFFVVGGEFGRVFVTHEVASYIRSVLDRRFVPVWIEFRDRVGSLVRVRTRQIEVLVESTVEQRMADRMLDRARDEEEKADRRPWDNE